jgi:hypothetical protein
MVYLNLIGLWRSQDGIVSVVTYCGVQTPVDARDFYLLRTCLDWPRGPPTLSAMGSGGGLFPVRDMAECGIDCPPLSSSKVKDKW